MGILREPEKELLNYFKTHLKQGYTRQELLSGAINSGWSYNDANSIMKMIGGRDRKPILTLFLLIVFSCLMFYLFSFSTETVIKSPVAAPIVPITPPGVVEAPLPTAEPIPVDRVLVEGAEDGVDAGQIGDKLINDLGGGSGGYYTGSSGGGEGSGSTGYSFNPFGSGSGESSGSSSSTTTNEEESDTNTDNTEFNTQALFCNEGDFSTQCNITSSQSLFVGDESLTFKNLYIAEGATITTAAISNISWTITGNATINGTISLYADGYSGGLALNDGGGPGGGNSAGTYAGGGGGGYGGDGGYGADNINSAGIRYNSSLLPQLPGSGGGGGADGGKPGGDGGGLVQLHVKENLHIGGTISVDASAAQTSGGYADDGGGGGSGGGILLNSSNITGNGLLSADGAIGANMRQHDGGGGGGGRIALLFNEQNFTGTMTVNAGSAGGTDGSIDATAGEKGTIAFIDKDDDWLMIPSYYHLEKLITYNFSTIYFMNNSYTIVDDWNRTLYAQNITIDETATITGNGQGYAGSFGIGNGNGPGGGIAATSGTGGGGGGYGGDGGYGADALNSGGVRYNSSLLPLYPGSGGGSGYDTASLRYGGDGGGWIGLQANDQVEIFGLITMDGTNAYNNAATPSNGDGGGGGSGGGILINASTIIGTGTLSADGGNGGDLRENDGGGGGGGRIALIYDTENFKGTVTVNGGSRGGDTGSRDAIAGEKGTIAFIDRDDSELYIRESFHVERHIDLNFSLIYFMNESTTIVDDWNRSIYGKNVILDGTALITGNGLGYAGSEGASNGGGYGGGLSATAGSGGGGGGYGGVGGAGTNNGASGGSTYDPSLLPLHPGSGGGGGYDTAGLRYAGDGGGWIGFQLTNKLTLLGKISMDGTTAYSNTGTPSTGDGGGGGSGGGVLINVSEFYGNGTITCNGGNGGDHIQNDGGGGGGGRIAVEFSTYAFTGTLQANGGSGAGSAANGGAGTIVNRTRVLTPTDPVTSSFAIKGTASGDLTSGTIIGENQTVNFSSPTYGKRLEVDVYSGGLVDFSNLKIEATDSITVVDASAINGEVSDNLTFFVPNNNEGGGVFVCPDAKSVAATNIACSNKVSFNGPFPQSLDVDGDPVRVSIDGDDYRIDGVKGTGVGTSPLADLVVFDDTDLEMGWLVHYVDNMTYFYANWTNSTTPYENISGPNSYCDFDINLPGNNNFTMTFNATNALYYYNRTISTAGIYDWNVTCNGTLDGFDTIFANDTVNISELPLEPSVVGPASLAGVTAAVITVGHEGYYNATWVEPQADTSSGANITELNFTTNASTSRWQGYYGEIVTKLVIGVETNIFFDWNSTGTDADQLVSMVYTSCNENFPFVDATNVSDASLVDLAYNFEASRVDSINETYRYVDDVGGTQTKSLNYASVNYLNGVFGDGTVNTTSGGIFNYTFGAKVIANDPDWLGETSDYMLLVPVNQSSLSEAKTNEITYYFFMEIN